MPVQTQMQVRRGTASSWTSTNPTLAAGELGFETDTGKFKIGTGASTWTALPYAGGGQNTLTTYQYTATASQTTFSGADINSNTLSYTAGAVQVYLNGALLQNTVDYAASTGTSVVLTAGAGLGDSLTILSLGSFTVSTDIPKSTLAAKGSIVAASGAATPANLSVGANDTVLTADSTAATGLKWAAPGGAGKGYTLINTGGTALTGATSITVSSLGSYESYIIYCNASSANASSNVSFRLNSDSGAKYISRGVAISNPATYTSAFLNNVEQDGGTEYTIGNTATSTATGYLTIGIRVEGAKSTSAKGVQVSAGFWEGSARTGQITTVSTGLYTGTSAITSFTILSSSGNFDQGTLFIYGSSN